MIKRGRDAVRSPREVYESGLVIGVVRSLNGCGPNIYVPCSPKSKYFIERGLDRNLNRKVFVSLPEKAVAIDDSLKYEFRRRERGKIDSD